jgi:hypothetical protein
MARKRIIIEDMVSGQQKTLECEGYLVCAFNDPVHLGEDANPYDRVAIEARNIHTVDVMGLMLKRDNPLAEAWRGMKKVRWQPRMMRVLKCAYEERD